MRCEKVFRFHCFLKTSQPLFIFQVKGFQIGKQLRKAVPPRNSVIHQGNRSTVNERPKELRAGKNWKFWVGHFKFQEQEAPTTPSLKPKCFREQKVHVSSPRNLFDKQKKQKTCFHISKKRKHCLYKLK